MTASLFSATAIKRYSTSTSQRRLIRLVTSSNKTKFQATDPTPPPYSLPQIPIMSGNDNPGNFANRSADDVKDAASKGGQTGTESSGFASMPKEKVVRFRSPSFRCRCL